MLQDGIFFSFMHFIHVFAAILERVAFAPRGGRRNLFNLIIQFYLDFGWFWKQKYLIILGQNLENPAIVRMYSFERVAFASGGREHLS